MPPSTSAGALTAPSKVLGATSSPTLLPNIFCTCQLTDSHDWSLSNQIASGLHCTCDSLASSGAYDASRTTSALRCRPVMYDASASALPNVLPRDAYSPRKTFGPSRS